MSSLSEIYKAAIDKMHDILSPASASTPKDPSGVAGRIGTSKAKQEAADSLNEEPAESK